MRHISLIFTALLLMAGPVSAQEDPDSLLELDLEEPVPAPANNADPLADDLLELDLEEPAPAAPAAVDDDLPLLDPTAPEDDLELDLEAVPVVDVPNPALEPTANVEKSGDAASDAAVLEDLSADALTDGSTDADVASGKKAKKEKKQKVKAPREKTAKVNVHNLSVMLSGAWLIDTGNVGITSPLLHLSVGGRPCGKQLLVAGEVGWGFFGAKIPMANVDTYKLNINVLTLGAKAAYWILPVDKISPYVAGNISLGLGFSSLAGRKDVMANVAGSVQAGVSIPVGHFAIMPHIGYWITGFSGDYLHHIALTGPFAGVSVQFTP